MKKITATGFQGIIPFAIAGLFFGLILNALFYPHTFVEYAEAGSIGIILGLCIGFTELLYLKRWLSQKPFGQSLLIRTILYTFSSALALALVLAIEPTMLGTCGYLRCIIIQIAGDVFLRDLVFTTAFVFMSTFTAQIVMLVGAKNFSRLLIGRFSQPEEIFAVFMFVDLKDSTSIAEKLGHELFSQFLRDYFNDISKSIYDAKGEIYQYVGDEVVIVWPEISKKTYSNWYKCFIDMDQDLKNKGEYYMKKYGSKPVFKAGVHAGLVVVTEVGTLQKAIVYHGDVLNTASRLEGMCNKTGYRLLISDSIINNLNSSDAEAFEPIGPLEIRGKSNEVVVYGGFPRIMKKT